MPIRALLKTLAGAALGLSLATVSSAAQQTLAEVYATLASRQFVDLTHEFGPGNPHWKGFGDEKVKTLYQIDPKDMLMPLVVLDVHENAAENPDEDC